MKMKRTLTMIATIQAGFLQKADTVPAFIFCKLVSFLWYIQVTCLCYKIQKLTVHMWSKTFNDPLKQKLTLKTFLYLFQTFELKTSGKSNFERYQMTSASTEIILFKRYLATFYLKTHPCCKGHPSIWFEEGINYREKKRRPRGTGLNWGQKAAG